MTDQPENPRPYDEPQYPHLGVPYGEWPQYPGATMRDYFAANCTFEPDSFTVTHAETLMGEAMPAFKTPKERYDWWLTAEAKYRYAHADAMLRERGK